MPPHPGGVGLRGRDGCAIPAGRRRAAGIRQRKWVLWLVTTGLRFEIAPSAIFLKRSGNSTSGNTFAALN